MKEHITIEEMSEFLTYGKADDRFRELAMRINPHITRCGACRETYQMMLTASDALERGVNRGRAFDRVQQRRAREREQWQAWEISEDAQD